MAKPLATGEVIADVQPSNLTNQEALTLQNKHNPNYTSSAYTTNKFLRKTTAVKILKHEVVNHIGEKIVKAHPKLAKANRGRFTSMYIVLGMIALAALLESVANHNGLTEDLKKLKLAMKEQQPTVANQIGW
jgi:hypothetical protein